MIRIGNAAPTFKANAIVDGHIKTISLDDYQGKYTVLLFYPLDFTFVCPTELHAFQEQLAMFHEKNTDVLAISIDSVYSHLAWLRTPKKQGGIEGVQYPLVSDIHKTISRDYGVLEEHEGVALRGLFLLDKNNVVQSAMVNNLPLGRNVHEVIRLLDALQFVENHGQVCPANWTAEAKSMKPTQQGVEQYFAE